MRLFSPSSCRITIILFFLGFSTVSFSQNSVSIGTTSTNPKAVLWLSGTNQGIIIPIVTNKTNVSAGPTEKGMVVFDDSDKKVYFFDGTAWNQVGGSGAGGQGIAINGNTVQLNSTVGSTFSLSNTAPTGKGQLLVWDGTKWDATLAPTTTGQSLSWDNTNGKWTLANASLTLAGDVSGPSNNTTIATTSGNNILAAVNNAATTSKLLPSQITAGTPGQVLTTSAGSVAVWANLPAATGTVTNIATGTGLTGGPITTTGTIALANTSVVAGTYGSATQVPQIAVDAQGRITTASNITIPASGPSTSGLLSTTDWNTFNNKLGGSLTNGNIFVGNVSNVATGVPVSGDALLSNTGVLTIQPSKITSSKILDGEIVDADINASANISDTKLATISTAGKVSGNAITTGTIGGNTIINTTGNVTAANISGNGSALTNLNASNLATGTVPTSRIDVGTTANKIVQLDGTGKLPAIDGSQLTNLPVGTETDPTVKAINGIVKSNGTTISAATAGTDYQAPLVSGTNIKTINGTSVLGAGNITAVTTETDPAVKAINGLVKSDGTTIGAVVSGTDIKTINGTSLLGAGNITAVTSETDPAVKAINGLVKSNGTTISAASAGTDYLAPNGNGSALTNLNASNLTTGTVPTARIDVGTTANKIVQLDGTGKLPAVDGSQLTNLPAGTETDPTVKAINGLVKSNGTTIAAAVAGTDYVATETDPAVKAINGLVKSDGTTIGAVVSGTDIKTINGTSLLGAGNITAVTSETDPAVKAINGLVKSNGTIISAAAAGTDYLSPNGNGSSLTNLNASNISSGTLAIANGGTGATTAPAARTALGLGTLATLSTVTTTEITDGTILDADIAAGAGIVDTKLATISTAGKVSGNAITSGTIGGNTGINSTGNITTTGTLNTGAATVSGLTIGSTVINWPTNASGSLTNDGTGNLTWVPAGGSGTVTSITKGVGIVPGSAITTSGTIDVNVGTGANQIVQLDGTGKLPAVDGSQLINLPTGTETDPTVKAINGLVKSNGITISAATAGTDYQSPLVSGTNIKTINGTSVLGAGNITALTAETDPAVKAINGLVKSDGTTIGAVVSGTDVKTINGTSILGAGNITAVTSETDPAVKAINGLVKSDGTTIGAVVSGTDVKTINGTSILGAGNITAVTSETDPAVKAINGLVKSDGTTIGAVVSGTDVKTINGTSILGSGNITTLTTVTTTEIADGTIGVADLNPAAGILTNGSSPNSVGDIVGDFASGMKLQNNAPTGANIATVLNTNGAFNLATSGTLSTGAATVTGLTIGTSVWPANASGSLTNDGTGTLTWVPSGGSGTVTSVGAGTGLVGGPITTSGSLSVDVGTTANKIVQLDGTGKLPAVDGSQLTNLPAGTETDPTVKAINGLVKSNGTTITAATAGTDYLAPNGNGSALTNLNASNISSGTLAIANGGTGATTAPAARTALGLGTLSTLSTVTSAEITDGAIADADINGTANINGAKINPAFGAQAVSTTSTLTTGSTGQFVVDATGNITKINNITTSFPANQGAANSVLTNDGAGNLTWATGSGWSLSGNTLLGGEKIGSTNGNPLPFITNNVERMRIDPAGKIGIGTTNPQEQLDIAFGDGIIRGQTNFAAAGNRAYLYLGDPNHYISAINNTGVSISTAGAPDGIFLSQLGGNVGIGTLTPAAKLDVYGGVIKVTTSSGGAGVQTLGQMNDPVNGALGASGLAGHWGGDHYLRGGWGLSFDRYNLGEANPGSGNYFGGNPDAGSANFRYWDGSAWRSDMVIRGSGNVGIATTNPTERLDVAGNLKFSGALMPNNTAGTAGQVLTSGGPGVAPTWQAISGTGTVTSVGAGTGLVGGPITTSGSLAVDVGTTANKIVQLDGTGKLPAVDGSQLFNLPAGTETDPTVKAINGLVKSNGTTISAATPGTDYVATETDPAVKAINGLVKSNGTTISAATAGTDYQAPLVSGTNIKTINGTSVLGAGNITAITTETDPAVKAINGLVKSDGTTIGAVVSGTDIKTINGTSILGAGNITAVTAETDPAVKAINGLVKSDGTTIGAVVSGTDVKTINGTSILGAGNITALTTETDPAVKAINGLVKSDGTTIGAVVSGTDVKTINGTSILGAGNITAVTTETDPTVKAINGLVKSNGTTISAATPGTDYVATETDPAVKAINGLVKSNGTTISAATAGTDYQVPLVSGTNIKTINGTSVLGAGNITAVTAETDPAVKAINGLVKSDGTTIGAVVSGTDVKTINGTSILGAGNITALTTVTSADITDGTIVDADINGTANINGAKINPAFGAQAVSTTSTLTTGSTGQFVVDATGNITKINNITTSFPANQGAANSVLTNDGAGNLTWSAASGWGLNGNATTVGNKLGTTNGNPLIFITSNTDRLMINAAGNVGIGTSTPTYKLDVAGGLNVSNDRIFVNSNSNDTFGQALILNKSRLGGSVLNNDELGWVEFRGNDGTAMQRSAMIYSTVDGAPTAGAVPGNLRFYTSPTSGGQFERMRIASSGNVGIGTTTPLTPLQVGSTLGFVAAGADDIIAHGIYFDGTNFINRGASANSAILLGDGKAGIYTFPAGAAAGVASSPNMRFNVRPTGVGIQVDNPIETFQVNGATYLNPITAPVITTDRLYNVGGNLFWNGTNISSGGSGWSSTGNAGTNSNTNFIGTTDNVALRFKTNNTASGLIDPITSNAFFGYRAGEVATGGQNVAMGANALLANTSGTGNVAIGTGALQTNASGTGNIAIGNFADVSSPGLINSIAIGRNAIVGASNSMVLGGTGGDAVNVGIGTTSPTSALDVVAVNKSGIKVTTNSLLPGEYAVSAIRTGDGDVTGFFWNNNPASGANAHGVYGQADGAGSGVFGSNNGTTGNAATFMNLNAGNANPVVKIFNNGSGPSLTTAGSVGIGLTTPEAKLDVAGATANNLQAIFTRGVTDPAFKLAASNGVAGGAGSKQSEFGMFYTGNGYGASLSFLRGSGSFDGAIGINTNSAERVRIDATGNVGIGTTTPGYKLDINEGTLHILNTNILNYSIINRDAAPGNDSYLFGKFTPNYYLIGTNKNGTGFQRKLGFSVGGPDDETSIKMSIESNGNVGIGTSAPQNTLDVNGSGTFRTGLLVGVPGNGNQQIQMNLGSGFSQIQAINQSVAFNNLALNPSGGNVGIGTTNPIYPLQVNQTALYNSGATHGVYSNPTGFQSPASNLAVGIYSSGAVLAGWFWAFSDARIKEKLSVSNSAEDLKLLMRLKVTDYSHIDKIAKGSTPQKGFIAQEVKEILPDAVNILPKSEFVPSIYSKSKSISKSDLGLRIELSKAHDLKVGDRVRLLDGSVEFKEIVTEIPTLTSFIVKNEFIKASMLFIYGKEISDMHTIDYDRIYTIGISAIQELNKKLDAQQKVIDSLQSQDAENKKKIALLEASLNKAATSENELASLKSEIEKIKAALGLTVDAALPKKEEKK